MCFCRRGRDERQGRRRAYDAVRNGAGRPGGHDTAHGLRIRHGPGAPAAPGASIACTAAWLTRSLCLGLPGMHSVCCCCSSMLHLHADLSLSGVLADTAVGSMIQHNMCYPFFYSLEARSLVGGAVCDGARRRCASAAAGGADAAAQQEPRGHQGRPRLRQGAAPRMFLRCRCCSITKSTQPQQPHFTTGL